MFSFRISIRWTSCPSFLRPGIISSSTDNAWSSTKRLFSHIFGTQASPLRSFILIGFIVVIFLGCLFFILNFNWYHNRTRRFTSTDFYEHGAESHYHYGIVIDCGSSGSRVFIYYWPPHNGNPDELLQIKQMKDPRGNAVRMKIKPGIIMVSNNLLFLSCFSLRLLHQTNDLDVFVVWNPLAWLKEVMHYFQLLICHTRKEQTQALVRLT